jgi:murein DD-endopeptidase MepM/ murein hydrolase activator NlpD
VVVEKHAGKGGTDTVVRAHAAPAAIAAVSRARAAVAAALVCLLCALCSGCSASAPQSMPLARYGGNRRPVEHVVRPGETVYHIAHVYGVSVRRLLAANHLSDPRALRVGQSLLIPGSYTYASLGGGESGFDAMWNVPRAARQFTWPVWSGTVTSGFGMRHGTMHDGVDIAAPVGTPVHAADSGVVVFVGRLHGYGNTVIIRHSDNYVTVYGHNSRILVSEGSPVVRGQDIAEVGTSGRTTGPNLHFEVRYDNHAYNPLSYLTPPGPAPFESFARNGPS